MKKIISAFIILLASSPLFAQNMVDAIRLSDTRIQGTARATAMGNAFGALGGDFTSASINPAGLGVYRSSEFVITTQLGNTDVEANYLGTTASDSKFNLSVPNIGYVVNFPSSPNSTSSLVSFSLGLGYNRMNNFNMHKIISGAGATSSMLDQFTYNLNHPVEIMYYDAYEGLAIETGLVYDYTDEPSVYYHDMQETQSGIEGSKNFAHDQRRTFSQKGSQDEYTISFAANFNHKVYLGATVGIQDVYYKETSRFIEDIRGNESYQGSDFPYKLNSYELESYLKTTGTGINFKVGAIFKPIDELRLGVAFHTPTFYDLHDSFDTYMYSNISEDGQNVSREAGSPYYDYDYRIDSPMKGVLSAAYIIGKAGLISVDYEYVDYSSMKLRDASDGWDYSYENNDIEEAFKAVGNLRIGAEYRVNNFFSLRGGYEYLPSPYEKFAFDTNQPNGNEDTQTYALGFGIKSGGVFFDLAYKHIANTNHLELYQFPSRLDLGSSPAAKMDYQKDYVSFTLGFRF
ncbi:OmpP1/FadL family transporter [Mangrovibacterium marinum]|uniref:Outer membrane protein transport protein (OMPP1/FadL/TodX) n=1 Tax=Mangrovibacterium marinum TaxID=1639118 RepID=A0A2T5C3V1_9BACT|nr:outer membrane protein transport protein [Mangrovibacterium marinum]PTN09409.1 outer membrane protein transport protein (OMPP1/FadL/TodX) [Mangrovibacterium marinum]